MADDFARSGSPKQGEQKVGEYYLLKRGWQKQTEIAADTLPQGPPKRSGHVLWVSGSPDFDSLQLSVPPRIAPGLSA